MFRRSPGRREGGRERGWNGEGLPPLRPLRLNLPLFSGAPKRQIPPGGKDVRRCRMHNANKNTKIGWEIGKGEKQRLETE